MVEQGTHKPLDVGSNPTLATVVFPVRLEWMMSKKQWLTDLGVYLAWFPIVALLFWVVLQLNTAIEIGLIVFYAGHNLERAAFIDVINKYSIALIICIWIVGIIIIEAYLKNGTRNKTVIKRFSRMFGPATLGLFLVEVFNLLMLDLDTAGWQQWLMIAGELVIGSAITYYGFVHLGRKKETGLLHS